MCFMNLFKSKRKKEPPSIATPSLEEEFQLPRLEKASFPMTEELRQRQQDEQLMLKYGIRAEKEGNFV